MRGICEANRLRAMSASRLVFAINTGFDVKVFTNGLGLLTFKHLEFSVTLCFLIKKFASYSNQFHKPFSTSILYAR